MNWFVKTFATKNGEISKTAIFLTVITICLIGLWVFQSLFAGVSIGWWLVPEFNSMAAGTVASIFSILYVASNRLNPNSGISSTDLIDMKKEVEDGINKLRGNNGNTEC